MSLEAAFLHDICQNPDDDAPRLVYADWLDDHGGAGGPDRAEFIRVQIELARTPGLDPARRQVLELRQGVLLKKWKVAWVKPFHGLFPRYEYHRGFIERVTIQSSVFIEHGPALITQTPLR